MAQGRIQWIDFVRGLVVILMVLGHVMPDCAARKIIFVFMIPSFFIMAGYVLNVDKWSPNFGEFTKKLAKRLILPYFIAEIIWYPIWYIFSHQMGFLTHLWRLSEADPVNGFFAIFYGAMNNDYDAAVDAPLLLGPMWFFPCLFLAEIIYLGLYKIFGKDEKKFIISLIIFVGIGFILGKICPLPQGLDIALVMQIFVLVGVYIRKYKFVEKINIPIIILSIISVTLAFTFNDFADISFRMYGNALILYVGGIGGTLLCIKFAEIFTKIGGKISDLISYCGLQSVLVVAIHIPIIMVFYDFIMGMNLFENDKLLHSSWTIAVICLILGVTIPLLIAKKIGKKPIIKYFCN